MMISRKPTRALTLALFLSSCASLFAEEVAKVAKPLAPALTSTLPPTQVSEYYKRSAIASSLESQILKNDDIQRQLRARLVELTKAKTDWETEMKKTCEAAREDLVTNDKTGDPVCMTRLGPAPSPPTPPKPKVE